MVEDNHISTDEIVTDQNAVQVENNVELQIHAQGLVHGLIRSRSQTQVTDGMTCGGTAGGSLARRSLLTWRALTLHRWLTLLGKA